MIALLDIVISPSRQLPPLRVERNWYQEKADYVQKLAEQMSQQFGDSFLINPPTKRSTTKTDTQRNFSRPYSEFESKFGRFADPLYSANQPEHPPSGVDPADNAYVFVDAHVLATPALADLDGDGERNELVVPVSFYFDPIEYGQSKIGQKILNGLEKDELMNFVAGGIVVFDLKRKVVSRKILKITRTNSDQPGYLLATPTVVRLSQEMLIIVGSATGELHALRASDLSSIGGFPLMLDSISSQVAVGDLSGTGAMNIIVGDHSGNVYCIDEAGKRVWEQETNVEIISSIRFADLEKDGKLEVVVTTQSGDLWILNGQDGTPYPPNYPMHLNIPTQSAPLLLHLNSTSKNGGGRRTNGLAVVLATSEAIYIIDTLTMCMDKFESEHVFMEILADDVDPYSPGLELLAISLDGYLVCFSTGSSGMNERDMALESWAGDAIDQNGFTHKSDSFALVLPHANNTIRDISGKSFSLNFQIYQYRSRNQDYTIHIGIGRKLTLHKSVVTARQKITDISLTIPTPPTPLKCFVTVQVCNKHAQCDSQSYTVNFNLHFEDDLKWLLALPFLFLCVFVLWAFRDASVDASLPVSASDSRKHL